MEHPDAIKISQMAERLNPAAQWRAELPSKSWKSAAYQSSKQKMLTRFTAEPEEAKEQGPE